MMDKKKTKRSKSKTHSDGHGQGRSAVKKKPTEVTREKEERERLEAANILSSLKFMAPQSSDVPKTVSAAGHASKTGVRKVTYLPTSSTTGISTPSTPSLKTQGRQPVTGGSVTVSLPPAVLSQLSQLQATMGTSLLSILKMQPLTTAKPDGGDSKVPSVVMSAEHSRLPLTLNPVKTVNKTVATALRQAVSLNTGVKQVQDNFETKSINEPYKSGPDITDHNEDKSNTSDKKKDSTENSLPLKKRRLVSLLDPLTSDLGSGRLSDLATAVQMDNILNLARDYPTTSSQQIPSTTPSIAASNQSTEGYRPVRFDPRTSLLVLSDLKAALTPDDDGDLPIHIAVVHENKELVHYPNNKSHFGPFQFGWVCRQLNLQPIHIAVVHENTELVKKFIDIMAMSGKSVDRYNKLQQTPLHLAVLVNKPDIVQALLGANADPNLVDRNGCTSTHIAITKRFFSCLHTIFAVSRKRVEVNTRNYEGYSPLHTAVENGDFRAMQFLNEKGAPTYINLNIQDGKAGRSVLFYATEYKRVHMVDYLINCGVNVDLQNYAGVSALMTAQAGGFDTITQLLTQALESQKAPEDGYGSQPKKIPIAPIPSKAKLIVQDSPLLRSRSNSLSVEGKPASVSRTSSTSSTSPMDLSLARKNRSPSIDQARRRKPDSFYTEPTGKGSMSEADKLASKGIKERHAQIIAALESNRTNLLSRRYSLVPSDLYSENGLEDFLGANKVKIKQEPIDVNENLGQSQGGGQKMDTHESSGRNDRVSNGREKLSSDMDVVMQDGSVPAVLEPMSTEGYKDQHDTESNDSPRMPVLSRAVSLTDSTTDINTKTNSQVSDSTGKQSINTVQRMTSVEGLHGSQGSQGFDPSVVSNSDKSQESMEVDSVFELIDVDENKTDNVEVPLSQRTNTGQCLFADSKELEHGSSADVEDADAESDDVDMDVNAIEMDAEDEDDEGLLVIDENVAMEKEFDKKVDSSTARKNIVKSSNNSQSITHSDNKHSVSTDHNKHIITDKLNHTDSGHSISKTLIEESHTITQVNTKDSALNHTVVDSEKQKQSAIQPSMGIPETSRKGQTNTDEDISQKQGQLSSLGSDRVTDESGVRTNEGKRPLDTHGTGNSINSLNEKGKGTSPVSSVDGEIHKTKSDVQLPSNLSSLDHTELGDVTSDKTMTKPPSIQAGHSRTLYVRDGDNYKPIKIFIDDSVQSSIVLQRMLEQASVVSGINTGNVPHVSNEGKQGTSVNNAVVSQHTPISANSVTLESSSHVNVPMESSHNPNMMTSNTIKVSHDSGSGNSTNHVPVTSNSSEMLVTKSGITTPKSAQFDAITHMKVKTSTKLTESQAKSVHPSASLYSTTSITEDGDNQSSVELHSSSVLQTVASKDKSKDGSSPDLINNKVILPSEAFKGSNNKGNLPDEPLKGSKSDTVVIDSSKTPGIYRTHSPVIADVSKKPLTTQPSSVSRKPSMPPSLPPAAPQSKVHSFLQNRAAVSTSEGTLTWVNPDIKSRLSKALQSPQRKLVGKVVVGGHEVETNQQAIQNIATNSVDGLDNVQTAIVSDARQ